MCKEIQSSEKTENVVEVKTCLSCPEASADLQTEVWSRILLNSGLNPEIPLFKRGPGRSRFHGLVLQRMSGECTLWAVEVNKASRIEILINQAIVNHTV